MKVLKIVFSGVSRHGARVRKIVFGNRALGFGATFLITLTSFIFIASLFTPPYYETFRPDLPPSYSHPLGTDSRGKDIFSWLVNGSINSMFVAAVVATLGTLIGSFIGICGGYFKRVAGAIFKSLPDFLIIIPMLPVLVFLAAVLRRISLFTMIGILLIPAWAWPAKQIRAQVLSLRERDYVSLAKLSGMRDSEIIFKELLPHLLPWMMANFMMAFVSALLAQAGLEILGLGPQHLPTLGMMIYWSQLYGAVFRSARNLGMLCWWLSPIILFSMVIAGLFLVKMGITDMLNPRRRARGK